MKIPTPEERCEQLAAALDALVCRMHELPDVKEGRLMEAVKAAEALLDEAGNRQPALDTKSLKLSR